MARLSQLFLITVLLSGIIALRGNSDEKRQIQDGMKICQDEYGESFYYDHLIGRCCPCTDCSDYMYPEPNVQCPIGGDNCNARYQGLCHSFGAYKPEVTTSPTTKFTDGTTKNKTQLTSHTPSDSSTSQGNGKVIKDDTDTLLRIVIPLMVAACIILICICVCCFMKNNRSFAESLRGKIFHSSFRVGKQSKPNPEYKTQESQESGQILLCEQSPADNYAPSPGCPSTSGSSSVSEDGPPEMVDCQHVGHLYDSSVSGVGSLDPHSLSSRYDSRFSNATSGGVAALQTRRPIEQRAQDATLFDAGRVVIANASGNGSVRTGDIHFHVHHPGANASHPMNMVNQQFVGSQFPYNPVPVVGGRSSRRDENIRRTIDRQSSEYSSTASAPVENDTNAHLTDKWNDSTARQDQFEALSQCQSDCYSQSGPVQHSSTTQHKVCSNRSQYTSMSSHVSQPQGDLEGNRRCATQAEAPSQD